MTDPAFGLHRIVSFVGDFWPVPEGAPEYPPAEFVEMRIRQSLQKHNILNDVSTLSGQGELVIGEVRLSRAASCQIRDMWWAARDRVAYTQPPMIPLKYFTFGLQLEGSRETVHVEILPGLDSWEPGSFAPE